MILFPLHLQYPLNYSVFYINLLPIMFFKSYAAFYPLRPFPCFIEICTLCYVVSFLFVVLYKMVAQKITCPSRSDDIGNKYERNTHRYGFFANGCLSPIYFESGRAKSFKESKGDRHNNRSDLRRRVRNTNSASTSGCTKLVRGKEREYDNYSFHLLIMLSLLLVVLHAKELLFILKF